MNRRVFRVQRYLRNIGVVFFFLGFIIAGVPIYLDYRGVPIMISGGHGHGVHRASHEELVQTGLWALLISFCGGWLWAWYLLASVTLDDDGIIVVNGIGQTILRLRYDQIESVGSIQQGNKETFFMISGAGQSAKLSNTMRGWDEIRTVLLEKTGGKKTED